jgi:hypothetical protein
MQDSVISVARRRSSVSQRITGGGERSVRGQTKTDFRTFIQAAVYFQASAVPLHNFVRNIKPQAVSEIAFRAVEGLKKVAQCVVALLQLVGPVEIDLDLPDIASMVIARPAPVIDWLAWRHCATTLLAAVTVSRQGRRI